MSKRNHDAPGAAERAQMLRSFWKQYPSYRVQPLLYKRYNEVLDTRAFNEWLENRRIRKEGEEYSDAVGRLTDTVNRRLPQLRYAPAERAGVRLPRAPQLRAGLGLHPGGGAHHSRAAEAQRVGLHDQPLLPRRLSPTARSR